ncbi:MAG: AhpC/TSA family protein [Bacteroidales bacterium]|nr:AhpC/TSA family protein [Bacteroidales bacterium]
MKRINLLKWIVLPISLIAIVGCSDSKVKYTIEGKLADETFEGANVYLFNAENDELENLDTTVIVNGTFTFKGELDNPIVATVCALKSETEVKVIECVLENGTILIDFDKRQVLGTPQNESFTQMLLAGKEESDAISELYKYMSTSSGEELDILKAKYDSLYHIRKDKALAAYEKTYKENTDNIVGAYAFYCLIGTKSNLKDITASQVDSMLVGATPIVSNFSLTVKMLDGLRKLEKTSVGKPYTDLDLLEGEAMTATKLSQHIDGKVALIDFWASWCGPCREEIPNIAEMHKKYADKGLVVIGLNVWDKPEAQQKAIETMNMTWLQLADTTKVATDTYGVNGIPQIMLIGKDGTILARDLRGEAIEAAIVEALK